MRARPAVVVAAGVVAPLGVSSLGVAMAARARRLVPQTLPLVDKRGQRVGACSAPGLSGWAGYARLVELAARALAQIPFGGQSVPMFLALPERARPDDDPRLEGEIIDALASAAGARFSRDDSRIVRAGHAGGALALAEAQAWLGSAEPGARALVGGVDSYLHSGVIRQLDEDCRLHAIGAENGFIPSEAAAFALLRGADRSEPRRSTIIRAAVHGEEHSVTRDEPNLAEAMTELVRRVVDQVDEPIALVVSDLNGERHRVKEWQRVALRTHLDDAHHVRLAELCGDVGAASGVMALLLAHEWWQSESLQQARALVALHSEGAARGALWLERAP